MNHGSQRVQVTGTSRRTSSVQDGASSRPQHAEYTISNWLSGLPDSQAPMPSPNAAPKNASKKIPPAKAADLGQTLAKKRSQDFKSKIDGWNETGAGVAQQHDEVVVIEDDDNDKVARIDFVEVVEESEVADSTADATPGTPRTPASATKAVGKQSAQRKTSREIDTAKKAWVRRKSKPAVELSTEVKQATTPKKRVVSDGHWRRDRVKETATPEKVKEKEKDTTPKPVTVRRSVVSVGLKIPVSVQDFVESEPEPVRVRPITRRTRSRSRSRDRNGGVEPSPDYESSGTKVYIKRRRRSRTFDPQAKDRKAFSTSDSSFTAGSSIDKPSTGTDITTPDVSPTKEHAPRPRTAPRERIWEPLNDRSAREKSGRQSLEAEDVTHRRRQNRPKSAEPPGRGVPDKPSKPKIPASKPPVPVPRVFGNRIEGWLAEMPEDPFTASPDRSLTPEPLRIHRAKARRTEDSENSDENGHRSSARRRKSRPNLEPIDTNKLWRPAGSPWDSVNERVHDSATPTLRRSGARRNTHSPVKDRDIRGASAPTEESTSPAPLPRSDSRRNTYGGRQPRNLPSRPRAPSDASEQHTVIADGSVLSRASDGDEPMRNGTGLKRRLTKHSDLMSVLSMPREDDHKIASARSIRTKRVRNETATTDDLMNEVTTDELKYQRELRTLVDGVIPVLLQYVLSKQGSTRTPGSRQSSLQDNPASIQSIHAMGVALERLKSSHRRIPMHDANELLLWAQSTSRVYAEYLQAWRLGFDNIVVNLAPADEPSTGGAQKWDNGLHRDDNSYPLSGDGERVDVPYLLKRPLVRVKTLSKTLQAISQIKPSALAEDMAGTYQELVAEARRRANDERARLEDEAAAAIDPTRARDARNLTLLSGVHIDPSRNVRARDYFDMELFHSSGQQVGCKIEIIRRDDPPSCAGKGDVLFCEISSTGRWLLFPPILARYVTARNGDKEGEIVVMVRGLLAGGSEWREVMTLQSGEEQAEEWTEMLGSDPMPPRLTRQSSFNMMRTIPRVHDAPPSPTESEVPIGERADPKAPRWDGSEVNTAQSDALPASIPRQKAKRYRSTPSSPLAGVQTIPEERYDESRTSGGRPMYDSGPEYEKRPRTGHARSKSEWTSDRTSAGQKPEYKVWLPASDLGSDESVDEGHRPARRPTVQRRTSSTPSQDMPTIPKIRKSDQRDQYKQDFDQPRAHSTPNTPAQEPSSAPPKLQKRPAGARGAPEKTSAPKQSARPTSLGLRSGVLPSFTPEFLKKHRRSSSPLKHEYEPSTATESSSEDDLSGIDDDDSVTSDSTVDEVVSTIGDLQDFNKFGTVRPPVRRPSKSLASLPPDSLGPSDSPSQAPYRSVPPTSSGSAKSVACIFSWSENGTWNSLHPEECEIVVTPGLIEAFDLAQAHAVSSKAGAEPDQSPSAHGVRPLVALELTPLVPLRRGTALDISVRSPPTKNSLLRNGNNIMFRSRGAEDCEKLYNLINRARIDNPTWIALQNARGPVPTSHWAESMDRRNAERSSTSGPSWIKSLSRKGSTYRSKGARSVSNAASQSSVGTMDSAMSALRKFSRGSRIFNIAKSTIVSREGTKSTYSDSLDSGAATPVPFDPQMGTPLGISNTKCRLYHREDSHKWRDMGSARLTIMLPPRPDPTVPADPNTTGLTKRVLISGKSKGETLLDVTLEERCFERVGRTGIAVTIWEELIGPNGELGHAAATGGVVSSRSRTFMVQMKSERDAAFTFSMVGKLRY
ncbi:hypothetical protein LTR37_000469 [Vermiconidia calcicola]|uniref:Uncharacterized protein n=1 Tax=Vermiconidia calcicola TaxID=1690605 RepID=A0ACC3NYL6_9PEZI|nr:hypothetical protein LTR37_000469 [Vermiconidia calcicola]